MHRLAAPFVVCSLIVLAAASGCVDGTIDDEYVAARRRDAGAASGNAPDDPAPAPPHDDDHAPDAGDGGVAPNPFADADEPVDASDEAAPPPPGDGGAPAPPSAYPSGPYGFGVGAIYPDVSFSGYVAAKAPWTTVATRDFYDPAGKRGLKAVLIVVSAAWCGPCRDEAKDLPTLNAKYAPQGVRFLEIVVQDTDGSGATQSTIDAWIAYAGLDTDVVADADEKSLPKASTGLPFNLLVDARTMKVVQSWSGADPGATSIPAVDDFLAKGP